MTEQDCMYVSDKRGSGAAITAHSGRLHGKQVLSSSEAQQHVHLKQVQVLTTELCPKHSSEEKLKENSQRKVLKSAAPCVLLSSIVHQTTLNLWATCKRRGQQSWPKTAINKQSFAFIVESVSGLQRSRTQIHLQSSHTDLSTVMILTHLMDRPPGVQALHPVTHPACPLPVHQGATPRGPTVSRGGSERWGELGLHSTLARTRLPVKGRQDG